MLVDIHSHQTASKPNIKKLFNLDIKEEALESEIEVFFGENTSVSIGIHPWSVSVDRWSEQLEFMERLVVNQRVKAIGEVGLDKIKGPDLALQEEVFIKQIRLAERVRKPIIVHCVKSYNEMLAIKKILMPKVPLILHGFNRKPEMAMKLAKKGFILSFGKALINSQLVQEALKNIPLEQVLFETDDSESMEISEIYLKACEVLNVELEELEEKIYQNYLELYL